MIKNYYEILGLPRNASQEQIAENYRKLALRYNPKTTKYPHEVAAKQFLQLGEPYQVLSDNVKRAYFDKYGYEKLKQGFYSEGKLIGGYRYANNADEIFQNFFKDEETSGKVLDLKIHTEGSLFGHAFGGLESKAEFGCDHQVVVVPCRLQELYKGATKTVQYERKVLNSDGRTTSIALERKTIHIKPGYHAGTVIQFPGCGHETVHRTVSDLRFEITELPHPKYKCKGENLIYTHDLSLADALDCKAVEVVTLDNRHISVGVDSIVHPQVMQEVVGEGLFNEKTNKRGNLYIKFNIHFPTHLSEEAKQELRGLLG